MKLIVCAIFALVLATRGWSYDLSPGSSVTLGGQVAAGVPVHEQKADSAFVRWPNGTNAIVVQDAGKWLQVKSADKTGWVLEKYAQQQDQEDEEGIEARTLVVGSWNLEYFQDGKKRGFPEYKKGAALPPRTPEDYQRVANAIREDLHAGVMVLNEIAGKHGARESDELIRLCSMMGPTWKYVIGSSGGLGGMQRVALLYDEDQVRLVKEWEVVVPETLVNKTDIFDRDPLAGFFRTRVGEHDGTDFIVVALHLASGQEKAGNHDAAMEDIRRKIKTYVENFPELRGEKDIIMAGDLNADRYDEHQEHFWESPAHSATNSTDINYVTFSGPTRDGYQATRVVGNDPPEPRSYIDYILGSESLAKRTVFPIATVHHELATSGDFYRYRVNYSDHFPVTISVKLTEDDDG